MNYLWQKKIFYLYVLVNLIKLNFHSTLTPAKLKKLQEKKLKKVIAKALEYPLYRQKFEDANIVAEDIKTIDDLKKIPVLTKTEFRNWMKEENAKLNNKYCMKNSTSGSTGLPMTILFTPKEYAMDIAIVLKAWFMAGYNPLFKKTLTRISDHTESVGYKTLIQKMGILRREYVHQFDPEDKLIEIINRYKPDLLQMNKSELLRIAIYAKSHNITLHKPQFYMPLGENIDDISYKVLTEAYGPGLISCYGCAEMGTVCVRIPGRSDFKILEDICSIAVNSKDSQTENEGSLLLTSLYRDTFPVINYAVGDRGTLGLINGFHYITEIQGREDDVLKFDNGKKTPYTSLWPIVAKCTDVVQIRFIQEDYQHIRLQIVKDEVSQMSVSEIEAYLTPKLREKCADNVVFEYEWLPVIPPDPNGKIRMIICNIRE